MSRKLTALMLSVFMVLSLLTPFSNLKAQDANLNEGTHNTRPVDVQNAVDYKALDEVADKEEKRSFIFVTDESSKVAEKLNEVYETLNAKDIAEKGNDYLMKAGFNDAISSALNNLDSNSEVKDKIKDLLGKSKGGLLETMSAIFGGSSKEQYDDSDDRNFNVVFSGFTMKMTTEEAMKVRESVPEVKQVFIDYTYRRPDEKPNMYNSTKMVNADQVWKKYNYKGEGRVVSVIDSGADINHPAMRLSDENKAALNKEKVEKLIKENLLKGQYLNPKFPYGYNFMDHNMDLKDTNGDTGMHGMHVSGTVGANATQDEADKFNNGILIKGVAPEAQVLVMRVFGQDVATTNTSAYIEAIEESIILGADSMNMSLGSMSGSEQGIDLGMDLALQNAKKAGSIVAIAGGNDFYTTNGEGNPRATNPDWGVMGTPGVAESAFTVANYNNNLMITDASTYIIDENGKEVEVIAKAMDTIDDAIDTGLESLKPYDIVDVGLGNTDEDYVGKDVKDKVVLAQRGGDSFANKIKRAQSKGAKAVLLGNNEVKKPDFFIIMQTQTKGLIPGYSVTYRNYEIIKKNIADAIKKGETPKIKINTKRHELGNPGEYQMNDSTSWGPNPTLRLKPEITAPGGEIFSTVNTDKGRYQSMTGTSMATPHVAGGIALVNQFLAKYKNDLNGEGKGADKHQFIKNLMMATATPILYKNNPNYYYSPRVQGAGLMNLENAVNPNMVTVVDQGQKMSMGKSVVEFGSVVDGKLDFKLKLHNYSDKAVTYKVRGIAQTDAVKDGKITFAPLTLAKVDNMKTVTVEAGQDAEFEGTIDVNDKVASQYRVQPNGFFIDGFIFFESQAAADGAKEFADLSVPYLAFCGDWAELPVIDVLPDEAFQETADGITWSSNVPFWYQGMKEDSFPGDGFNNWNFTHFFSRWSDGGRMIQGYQAWSKKYLDTYAISPNGDSRKDDLGFRGVFLRNADGFKIEYINEKGIVVRSIEEPYRSIIRKSSYKGKFSEDTVWVWRGENNDGAEVPDGDYTVRVSAKAQDNDGTIQTKERTVYVDRVKPEIELLKDERKDNVVSIEFKATDDRSGISWMDVFNMKNDKGTPAPAEFKYEEVPGEPNSLIVRAKWNVKEDFDFESAKKNIWIGAMDMAGNYFERTLETISNNGKVTFELVGPEGDENYPKELPRLEYSVPVLDKEGKQVIGKDGKPLFKWYNITDTNNLWYGTFYPVYLDAFPDYSFTFEPDVVNLTKENPEAKVKVIFAKKEGTEDYGVLSVYVTNAAEYKGGEISLFAVSTDAEGKKTWYRLPRKAGYSRDAFEANLPAGEYTIVAEGTAKAAPILEIGNTLFTVKARETSEINTRLLFNKRWISFTLGTEGYTFDNIFGQDIVQVDDMNDDGTPKLDKNGNQVKINKIMNLQNYFDVIDADTGNNIKATEAKIVGYYDEPGYEEITIDIPLLSGFYKLVAKFDLNKYKIQNPILELKAISDNAQRGDNTKYMCLYPADLVKGSLKVDTEFVTKDTGTKPNVKYELYNSRGEFIEDWTNLLTGEYTLKTWVQGGYRPERTDYKISITAKNPNVTHKVRWFKLSEETRINPIVEFGLNGSYASEYGKPVTVKLTNKETGKTLEPVEVPVGKVKYNKIPAGEYSMEIELDPGWDYVFFTDIGSSGDKSQGSPDEVTLTSAYNYIEIRLIKKEKPVYDTKYKLEIKETGLENETVRPKYALVDANNDKRYYTTDRAEFINITPGKYKLYVDTEPTGFTASPKVQDIEILAATDPAASKTIITKAEVTYTKATNKIKINSVVVDKDGNEIEEIADPIVVDYIAYTVDAEGNKTVYDIGSLPVNVEVTIVPKNVKAPYALYEDDKNGINVTLNGAEEKEIAFRYVVNNERLNVKDLEDAIAEAEDMLKNAKLEAEYKNALEEALTEAVAYYESDNKTQAGVFEAGDALWGVIDDAVYMVTVTFDPDNDDSIMEKDIVEGETVAKPEKDPTKPGFTFEGWYLGDEEFDFETKVMNDITLIAKWNKIVIPTPTPDEPSVPDYPIIPDYPVIPHRPHRPSKPTKDIVKEPTKPVEKPIEEKKDYGIVETMPTIAATFSDLPENEAAGSIMNMVARGILKGMDNGKFEGELPITRAMVATVLKRLSKDQRINNVSNFTDVKDTDWFAEAVKWAQSQGLIKGYEDGTFKANNLVTRQELAVIIERFLKIHGITMEEIKELSYKDLDTLPAWSKDAIIAMAKIGLVEGQTEEMYNPASEFTREELAVMLEKIIVWVEKH